MKPKVSIIVPIYNVELYLERCFNSLLSQRLQEIEIIAVNDGSTDRCGQIIDEFSKKDSRIVAIHQSNQGVSDARNCGILAARGEYIGFVDPDDWIDSDMYKKMYQEAVSEQADIVMCTYIREFGTHSKEKLFELPDKTQYRGKEIYSQMLRRLVGPLGSEVGNPEYLDAWGTVWSKLYRTEIIKENGLAFVDLRSIGTNEDSFFNIQAFYYASSIVFLNRPYYHYWRVNVSSVTAGYKPELMERWFHLYDLIEEFLKEKDLPIDFFTALNNRICLNVLGLGLNTISQGNRSPVGMKIKMLNSILNDQRIQQSFRDFPIQHCPKVWRVFFTLVKKRFVLGYYFMLILIEGLRKVRR